MKFAGKSREKKLAEIRSTFVHFNATGLFISKLDDIAWTLNIRGADMSHQPVGLSFLLISQDKCIWFINPSKVGSPLLADMEKAGVILVHYDSMFEYLSLIDDSLDLLVDPADISDELFEIIDENLNLYIVEGKSPVPLMKSSKNSVEVEGARSACAKDGAAMTKFIFWLSENVGKIKISEISCGDMATKFRSQMELFQDISFDPIVAYQEHGALCHYSATEKSDVEIQEKGLLLIDSGGHYLDGTTDITRTIGVGPLTDKQKKDYTCVLKAHINLASAKFHESATGRDLDILARTPLWKEGLQYGHGAGHGIGSYLMVHEGPAGFGHSGVKIKEGMILTNEPGLYREGEHGIRIENMITVVPFKKTGFGTFLKFETLSMCPIDLSPVIFELLSEDEINWLNNYHKKVIKTLKPLLTHDEVEWLKKSVKLEK